MDDLNDLERGLVAGLVIGEGHFGADRSRAQVVVKLHVRHEPLLRWLAQLFPRGALYGPYRSDGREWMQWMGRGAGLVCDLLPAVEPVLRTGIDPHVLGRLDRIKVAARAYMDGVRTREASSAYYRAPREKLTVAD